MIKVVDYVSGEVVEVDGIVKRQLSKRGYNFSYKTTTTDGYEELPSVIEKDEEWENFLTAYREHGDIVGYVDDVGKYRRTIRIIVNGYEEGKADANEIISYCNRLGVCYRSEMNYDSTKYIQIDNTMLSEILLKLE